MLNTRLILIEGLPGAGKSTTTVHLGKTFEQRGIPCRWFREDDDPHPIPCLDFDLKDLPRRLIPLWMGLVEHAAQAPAVTIIESRLWQNTALFMFMSEWEVKDILQFNRQVWQAISPLSPILIYLDECDVEKALRRVSAARGEAWMASELAMTSQYPWFQSRGLTDFAGWVRFFGEWQPVAQRLYDDLPGRKIRIENAHDNWESAYRQMGAYLQVLSRA